MKYCTVLYFFLAAVLLQFSLCGDTNTVLFRLVRSGLSDTAHNQYVGTECMSRSSSSPRSSVWSQKNRQHLVGWHVARSVPLQFHLKKVSLIRLLSRSFSVSIRCTGRSDGDVVVQRHSLSLNWMLIGSYAHLMECIWQWTPWWKQGVKGGENALDSSAN